MFIKTIMKKQARPHKLKGLTGTLSGFKGSGQCQRHGTLTDTQGYSFDSERAEEARRAKKRAEEARRASRSY